jgi:hypothetical protein
MLRLHGEALETAASIVIQANGEPFQPRSIGARGSELAIVETGSGYECRTRKGDASAQAKTSEHATGNAVDIMALGLTDKRQIAISVVADQNNPDHRLLMALRLTACGYFTTVLGPGANAAHANHYHLDLGVHGTSGNYRICE